MAILAIVVFFCCSPIHALLFLGFGVLIDIDHVLCQWDRFLAFTRLVPKRRAGKIDFDQLWVKAKKGLPYRVNYFHTWIFGLALIVATIFFHFLWIGLVAYTLHIFMDIKKGYGEKDNPWEIPGIVYRKIWR